MLSIGLTPLCVQEPPVNDDFGTLKKLHVHLGDLLIRLEMVRAAVVVSVAALREQNCDIDEDVAIVLQRQVGDPLGEEIEKTTQFLASLGRH